LRLAGQKNKFVKISPLVAERGIKEIFADVMGGTAITTVKHSFVQTMPGQIKEYSAAKQPQKGGVHYTEVFYKNRVQRFTMQ
jgi:hypothetical protein